MQPQRPAILFIRPSRAPFVELDLAFLGRRFPLRHRLFHFKPFWRQLADQIAQLLWLLGYLGRADLLFIWFADYHSLLPTLLGRLAGKKVVIVVGGYDVARLPDYQYGAHLRPFRSFCSRLSLRLATLLLPVSSSTAGELAAFAPHAPARVVYNGVDTAFFTPGSAGARDWDVLTVCGARDVRSAAIKSIDLFIAVARLLPQYGFYIIGLEEAAREWVRSLGVPANVRIEGQVGREQLARIYARSRVYCQFSRHESFGMALAEAMASGCLPVVTATGAMPEVVGDAGWVVPASGDPAATTTALAAALAEALSAAAGGSTTSRLPARQRIIDNFSLRRRQAALNAALLEE